MIHAHVCQDTGYGQWVDDVRFARAAGLPGMGLFRIKIRPANFSNLVNIQIVGELLAERINGHGGGP
jgi:hypothetical protein